MSDNMTNPSDVVVIKNTGGHTVISRQSPLKRLHYFDGKFLRATDLNLEQQALLNQVRLSNQAGGSGVVHGYSCTLIGGDRLDVGPGLAIDPAGRVLHLPEETRVGIPELIEKSRRSLSLSKKLKKAEFAPVFGECESAAGEAPETVLEGVRLYLITVGHAEAYCGEEDVYGKLCEEACITSTERPYVIEGVVLRALPWPLPSALTASRVISLSTRHLRSRVAAAYFAAEQRSPASLISGEGLSSSIWCRGAEAAGGAVIPIAVIARAGGETLFLDTWTARREGMETPPHRYWAGRMAMRPWNVFLAQVLQFQCQLVSCFAKGQVLRGEDPCAEEKKLAGKASKALDGLLRQYGATAKRFAAMEAISVRPEYLETAPIRELQKNLAAIAAQTVTERYLINCGIIELPSGGYLPVHPNEKISVNKQVRRLLGEGVDLRFCAVRPDYIPHALEEARHMERISLLAGIDDPAAKPGVDVLVPDGRIEEYREKAPGTGYEMDYALSGIGLPGHAALKAMSMRKKGDAKDRAAALKASTTGLSQATLTMAGKVTGLQAALRGAARGEELAGGGSAFYYAAQTPETQKIGKILNRMGSLQLLHESGATETPSEVLKLLRTSVDRSDERLEEAEGATTAARRIGTTEGSRRITSGGKYERLIKGLRINALELRKPSQAIWMSLRTDEDPFALGRGEATRISARVLFVYSRLLKNGLYLILEDVSVSGLLRVDDLDRRGGDTRLTCRLKVNGVLNTYFEQSGEHMEQTFPVRLDEKVFLLRNTTIGPRPSYRVRVINPSIWAGLGNTELRFERVWTDSSTAEIKASLRLSSEAAGFKTGAKPDGSRLKTKKVSAEKGASLSEGISVTTGLSAARIRDELPIFSGRQKINADALKPGNSLHSASLSALTRLGAALKDSNFADFAARRLFPPPQPVPDELRVFAVRDWVLFHRRRDITCGFEKTPEALVRPRRFRIFQATVANEEERVLLRDGLLLNRPEIVSRFKPRPVTVVEFEAGIQSVRTSHDDVRDDWLARVGDDADIALGVIAARGGAYDEGRALAEARLNSLTDVLGRIAELSEDGELLWAEQIPEPLAGGEVDGIIVYATQGVATVCHEVFRLELEAEQLDAFMGALQEGADYRDLLLEHGGVRLNYTPRFRDGEQVLFGETAADDLVTSWGDAGNRSPVRAIPLLPLDGDGNLPTDQPYREQSMALADTLATGAASTDPIGVAQPLLECPAVTVLVVEPEAAPSSNDVYGFVLGVAGADGEDATINPQDIKTLLENGGLLPDDFPDSSTQLITWYPLGAVTFDGADKGDILSLNAVNTRAIESGLLTAEGTPFVNRNYYVLSLSRQGADSEQVSRDKEEAEQIRDALNLAGDVTEAVHGKPFWPTEADAMTLVLIPYPFYHGFIPGDAYIPSYTVLYTKASGTSPADESIVTDGPDTFRYDPEGALVKNAAFKTFIARMKEKGVKIKTIEVVSAWDPTVEESDPRAETVLLALKEEGVAENTAKVTLRKAGETEREMLGRLGSGVTKGLVLRK